MSDSPTFIAIQSIRSILYQKGYTKILHWLNNTDFFDAPASSHYHGTWSGGLAEHSWEVYKMLKKFTDAGIVKWDRPDSPFIIGVLHDVCKIDTYETYLDYENVVRYRHKHPISEVYEHGSLSVKLIEEHGLKLTDRERMCIWYHMGTWTKDIEDTDLPYNSVIHKYPAVLWTHTADMYASQVIKI